MRRLVVTAMTLMYSPSLALAVTNLPGNSILHPDVATATQLKIHDFSVAWLAGNPANNVKWWDGGGLSDTVGANVGNIHPDIFGTMVVFERNTTIRLYDFTAPPEVLVAANLEGDSYPTIDDGNIAWRVGLQTLAVKPDGGAGMDVDVCAFPCLRIVMPQIWSDIVVWHDSTQTVRFSTWDEFGIDAPEDLAEDGTFPHVHKNRVVFQSADGTTLYYTDRAGGAWNAPKVVATVPANGDESCAGVERPRVGGPKNLYPEPNETPPWVIWRGVDCWHDGAHHDDALYMTRVFDAPPGDEWGDVYFVGAMGPSAGDNEPTDYDIWADHIVYRSPVGGIIVVDVNEALIEPT